MDEKEYSRHLSDFRGIDTTSEASQVALNRFSFIQNMYKDYKSGQGTAVETFVGSRTLADFGGKINGIYTYKSSNDSNLYIVVHSGTKLYRFLHDKRDEISVSKTLIYDGLADRDSQGFVFNNRLYIIDGEHYVFVDENGVAKEATDEAYIPTTYVNGEQYEQRNMLTDKFIEKTYVETVSENIVPAEFDWPDGWKNVDGNVILSTILDIQEIRDYSWNNYNDKDATLETETTYNCKTYGSINISDDAKTVKINFDYWLIRGEILDVTSAEWNENGGYWDWDRTKSVYHEAISVKNYNPTYYEVPADPKAELTSVKMLDHVTAIEGTFEGCTNLSSLRLSNNITSLGDNFFANTALETIKLPRGLKHLGKNAFDGCSKLKKIYAPSKVYKLNSDADKDEFIFPNGVEIIRYANAEDVNQSDYGNTTNTESNKYYVYTPCVNIDKVMLDDQVVNEYDGLSANDSKILYKTVKHDGCIIAVSLISTYQSTLKKNLYIHGTADATRFTSVAKVVKGELLPDTEEDRSILGSQKDYKGTAVEAIKHCSICATFDDRIFFTGNPELPNTVFYTQRDLTGHNNPLYVGVLNYFNDGVGNTPNVAMMANASTLMVLKGNTLQDGSIFYHVGADGGNDLTPRIYPSTEGLAGLGCVGLAVNFRDDCVFMSSHGLEAIAKQTVNLERTIEHRSTNIDGLLLQSNLANARAAEWEGYLCILIDGKMFLADSRQMFEGIGGVEYEWYYINPVGAYLNEYKDYHWVDMLPWHGFVSGEYKVYPLKYGDEGYDVPHYENIFSDTLDTSVGAFTVYYQVIDGVKYVVDSEDGAYQYGTYDAARTIFCVEDVLYFGTNSGCLVCLNNDKRGEDENEPDKSRIPAKWYNNSGHNYDAVAILAMENAGVPHYTKTTVKRGTVIRFKSFSRSFVEVSASTDRQSLTLLDRHYGSVTNFGDLDFANLGLLTTESNILAIKEKTKKWVEKQYMFRSDRANQPFGLYSISYRYIITGGVKNK